jgi:hypothetical protein
LCILFLIPINNIPAAGTHPDKAVTEGDDLNQRSALLALLSAGRCDVCGGWLLCAHLYDPLFHAGNGCLVNQEQNG